MTAAWHYVLVGLGALTALCLVEILLAAPPLDARMDTRLVWSEQDFLDSLESMGESGQASYVNLYLGLRLGGDLAFPVYYGSAGALLLYKRHSKFWHVPLATALADTAENLAILCLLREYPNELNHNIAFVAGALITPLKFILTFGTVLALLVSLAIKGPSKKVFFKVD
mmetsp:Transcript_23951/g.44460  ORF Transcript_23951/g.44460 Transcript_23951/m.44460 type:complete len:169 (+) Transcript_23951:65-571(+)